ncbi:FG-GAP repeat protein [Thermocaproicibacter melissae]|uniref:FG-GAP repeat protein n=1 Tax=Thermocaproicibacter melissae TaxID=2966552 RepID=UPI0024B12F94|nr:FG-GAP repeat protein [Thermocaproicibacter melissae]WBY63783.1 FG-GAP repeat protein [Thermocaproicibacter melissae]
MKRKAALLAIVVALATMLSGCSFAGLDAGALMHAPKPTGANEADIQNLLDKTAGGDYTLKYPAAGDNRSAILEHPVGAADSDAAVAFYQKDDEPTVINVVFMQKTEGEWKIVGSFHNQASEVERVCFGDLDGDGRDETIVGWGNSLNNNSTIFVYYYQNGRMNELKLNQNYSEMEVMDFVGDGRCEIFTACVTVGAQPAVARLIRVTDGNIEVLGTAPLDSGVTRYASVKTGLLDENQNGVVLDGIKASNTMETEVIYWDKKQKMLVAPFYDIITKTAKSTTRNTSVVSRDVNNDKIIEIPFVTLMPGYTTSTTDGADFMTTWHRYDTENNTFVRVMSMVINETDGYSFSIPDMWRGKVTTKLDPSTRSFSFYKWNAAGNGTGGTIGNELLRIRAFSKKEWSSIGEKSGYFSLYSTGSLVYAARNIQPDDELSLTKAEVEEAFQPIWQD